MRTMRKHRLFQGSWGCFALLLYLALTLAGSFHHHHAPMDTCGLSCPAGHGTAHHSVTGGHDHAFSAAEAGSNEPCRLCAWMAASRIGAPQVMLVDEAPDPAEFIQALGGARCESVDSLTLRTRAPPSSERNICS